MRAHFNHGIKQRLRCLIASALTRVETCRECSLRHGCHDYQTREKLLLCAYGNCSTFGAMMVLDVEP